MNTNRYKRVGGYIKVTQEWQKSDYRKRCEFLYLNAHMDDRLGDMERLFKTTDQFQQMILISARTSRIKFVKNPGLELIRAVLEKNPMDIYYFPDLVDENLQLYVVEKEPELVKFLSNPCLKVQEFLLEKCESAIKYIKNIDLNILKKSVWKNPEIIKFFPDTQDPELQLSAVVSDPHLVSWLHKPSRFVQEFICQKHKTEIKFLKQLDMDLLEKNIIYDPCLIEYFGHYNLSESLQDFLYETNPRFLSYLQNVYKELQYRIYNEDPKNLYCIKNKCEEIKVHQILDR